MDMQGFEKLVPLIVAIISAITLLAGYTYQKHKEKEAEIRKTRQEIYSRLVTCITKRFALFDRLEQSPAWKKARNYSEQYNIMIRDPETSQNLAEQKEIATLLCLYGPDDAIKAYVDWLKGAWDASTKSSTSGNLGKLIIDLRKSIYPETNATADDANLAIWNNAEHLEQARSKEAKKDTISAMSGRNEVCP